jgi:hypothetical protein
MISSLECLVEDSVGNKMIRVLLIAGLIGMAGCAAQRQATYERLAAECRATIPEAVGNYVKRTTCLNNAATQAGFHGPAEDLLQATLVSLAERVDRGEITSSEANLAFAKVKYQIEQPEAAQRAQQAAAAAPVWRMGDQFAISLSAAMLA